VRSEYIDLFSATVYSDKVYWTVEVIIAAIYCNYMLSLIKLMWVVVYKQVSLLLVIAYIKAIELEQ